MTAVFRTAHQTAAMLCTAIYDYPGYPTVSWDAQTKLGPQAAVYWRMVTVNGVMFWICRGSANPPDWYHDFYRLAIPKRDPKIKWVVPGFNLGTDDAINEMLAVATLAEIRRSYFCGHSLGAAHADDIVAKFATMRATPAGRVVFGEPRPGFSYMCKLAAQCTDNASYRNAKPGGNRFEHDLVTNVPFRIMPILPYGVPTERINMYSPPQADDPWELLAYHHMTLYDKALNGDTGQYELARRYYLERILFKV